MTDKQRVLRRLRTHGSTTPTEWIGPHVVDGGKPIQRLAPRICELRKEGVPVETARTKPCSLYVLASPTPVIVEASGQYALTERAA